MLIDQVLNFLADPFFYPLDPSRRIFIGFLLSSAIIVVIYNCTRSSENDKVPLLRLFSKSIWLHPSSMLDLKVLSINSLLKVVIITPMVVSKIAVVLVVSRFCYDQFGPSSLSLNYTFLLILFTFTLFIVEDASRFFQHWLMHKIPFLWRIHKVHHQAEVLTPLTLYRMHPIEILMSAWRAVIVLGVTTGIFASLFPGQLNALEILGVDALGFLFNAFGANLRHSPYPVGFGKLNHIFISPVMHQIHHSANPKHRNKNFGSCFSIWDKFAGSFYIERENSQLEFGCRDGCKHSLSEVYLSPIKSAMKIQLALPALKFPRSISQESKAKAGHD